MITHTSTVPCSCCDFNCDRSSWGLGYDDLPDSLSIYGHTVPRVGTCYYWLHACGLDNRYLTWQSGVDGPCEGFSTGNIFNIMLYRTQYNVPSKRFQLVVNAPYAQEPTDATNCSAYYSSYIYSTYNKIDDSTSPFGTYTNIYSAPFPCRTGDNDIDGELIGWTPDAPQTITIPNPNPV